MPCSWDAANGVEYAGSRSTWEGCRLPAIVVEGLHKHYGPNRAVDGIDLTVEEGEVLALLGPNGAGKTTAVEILEGHRTRADGEVSVPGV